MPAPKRSFGLIETSWPEHHTPALMVINHTGSSSAQAKAQQATNPINACPHSSSPQSRISSRTGETAFAGGMTESQTFTGIITKYAYGQLARIVVPPISP